MAAKAVTDPSLLSISAAIRTEGNADFAFDYGRPYRFQKIDFSKRT
jgi:hypothetical protein